MSPRRLRLEEVSAEGDRGALGEVGSTGVVPVGREPGAHGITIARNSVSRIHGSFSRIRSHWIYRDEGSTNGSWHNGRPVGEQEPRIVRSGDIIQCADTAIRVVEVGDGVGEGGSPFSSSTLVVFREGAFLDEYPLPEYGRALVVGGSKPDLSLDGHTSELPRMVIERQGDKIVVRTVSEGAPVSVNGESLESDLALHDGDSVSIGSYAVLVSDARSSRGAPNFTAVPGSVGRGVPSGEDRRPSGQSNLTGSSPFDRTSLETPPSLGESTQVYSKAQLTSKVPRSLAFGRGIERVAEDDVEGTVALDPAQIEARLVSFEGPRSHRYQPVTDEPTLGSIEDRIMVLVGFVALLLVVFLLIWWAFLTPQGG